MAFEDECDVAILEESSDGAPEQANENEPRHRHGMRRHVLVGLAVLAVVGFVLLATTGGGAAPAPGLRRANARAATVLTGGDDPCRDFPFLDMRRIVRNNLGNKGPGESGEEGIVFQGVDIDPGHENEDVDLHINALTEFKPAWVNEGDLGFADDDRHFMRVNLKAGEEVTLKLAAMEPGTSTPKTLRRATFTFFDLDAHASMQNKEYVRAEGATGTITYAGTELVESDEESGKMFKASRPGHGGDNPTNPLRLTEEQLQRAVTFIFQPFTETTVTLGSTSGNFHGRKFDFVGRPSLQCANGVEPEKVVVVEDAPQDVPTCCVFKFATIQLVCVPAEEKMLWHFMC